jgi:hypothetical protein
MRAVFLTVVVAVTALRFSERSAIRQKVADFEASTVAYQKSRSALADSIVADFEASTIAYQKSQESWSWGNFSDHSSELAYAELALTPPRHTDPDEETYLNEVDQEAREDVNGSSTSVSSADGALSPVAKSLLSKVRSNHSKTHVLARIRAHRRAHTHSLVVDLPGPPAQQTACDPGITVCLPCDGTEVKDSILIPRILQSIAGQSCLPEKVILAISGISPDDSAELREELPDYKDLFAFEINDTAESHHAGVNRNRCVAAADTEVVSFFDVDDIMHPRRLELLSIAFGNYHPKAVVHAYEESPKLVCESAVKNFTSMQFGDTFQIFDGLGIYDLSLTPDAEAKNSLRTPNNHGLNHAGHISVLRSVFSEVQQTDLPRGQDAKFARDILKHFGRHEDTMVCLDVPLTLYCHEATIRWAF